MRLNKAIARQILEKLKPLADEAEVYINSNKTSKIDVIDQSIESIDDVTDTGLAIRVIKDKKTGFAFTADLSEEAIDDIIDQVMQNSKDMPSDDNCGFPEASTQTKPLSLIENDLAAAPFKDKIKLAIDIENAAYAFDKRIKKSEKTSYQDTFTTTIIANSKGIDISYKKAVCGAFTEVIAEQNKQMEAGSWIKYSTKFSELDASAIGIEAAKRAVNMLGAGQAKSGWAPVVLSPFAGSVLFSAVSPALSAEYIQKGKSIFIGGIGKLIASRKLTIIDSGLLAGGIACVPYDDEGVPTGETIVMKDGFLRSYIYNNYYAKKNGLRSTANAFRLSFKAQPEIQPTNFYVSPGHRSQDELIGSVSKGFLVTNLMGAHTINAISGDFSIGFSGFLIENGKLSAPVRGMTIAGNILDVFNHVEEAGSDILFFPHNGNIGSPSVLLSGISVSGS